MLVVDLLIALFPALDGGNIGTRGETTALLLPHGDSVFEYSLSAQRTTVPQVRPGRILPGVEWSALRGKVRAAEPISTSPSVTALPQPQT